MKTIFLLDLFALHSNYKGLLKYMLCEVKYYHVKTLRKIYIKNK
jgi:hypothetical protein